MWISVHILTTYHVVFTTFFMIVKDPYEQIVILAARGLLGRGGLGFVKEAEQRLDFL